MLLVIGHVVARQRGVRRGHATQLEANLALGQLEGVAAAQIDAAARRIRVHTGQQGVVQLDHVDAGDRHLLERVLTAGIVVGGRRRHTRAVHGEGRVFRRQAPDTNRRGVHLGIVQRQTRHGLHELADVTHGEGTKIVGRHHVLGVHGHAALHQCLGLSSARRRHHNLVDRRDTLCVCKWQGRKLDVRSGGLTSHNH